MLTSLPDNLCGFRCCCLWSNLLIPSAYWPSSSRIICLPRIRVEICTPSPWPPSATAYEADRDALTAQFDAAEALLKEIQQETTAVRIAVEEQKSKVDAVTEGVAAVVKDMREGEVRTRDEMREIRQEVDNVRDMLPKVKIQVILPYVKLIIRYSAH